MVNTLGCWKHFPKDSSRQGVWLCLTFNTIAGKILANNLFWRNLYLKPSPPAWVTMEVFDSNLACLPALLATVLPLALDIPKSYTVVKHSILIWSQFRKNFGLQLVSLKSPKTANYVFAPSMADDAFKIWHRKGLSCFEELYMDNCFASFSQLTETFGLAKPHFFTFFANQEFCTALNGPILL